MIGEYEKLLLEGSGTTFGKEGYGSTYNATEADDSTSLAESIIRYAEHATIAESKAADLEAHLAALEIAHQTNFHHPRHQIDTMPQKWHLSLHNCPSFNLPRQTNHSSSSSSHGQDNHPAITNAQNVTTLDRCDHLPLTAATPTSTQHNPLPHDSSSQQVAATAEIETGTTTMHLSQTR
jgi:hypothetical protein